MLPQIIVGLFVVFTALVLWLLARESKKRRRLLDELARKIDASLVSWGTKALYKGRHQGKAFSFWYFAGNDEEPSYLTMRFPVRPSFKLTLTPEGGFEADDDRKARAFLDSSKKALADQVLGFGAAKIELDPNGLRATWTPFLFSEPETAANIARALPFLEELSRGLIPSPEELPPDGPTGWYANLFVIAELVFIVFGGLTTYRFLPGLPVDFGEAFLKSTTLSLPILTVLVWWRTTNRRDTWKFLAGLATTWVALSFFVFLWLNCTLDGSSKSTFSQSIVGKRKNRSKENYGNVLEVSSWRKPTGKEHIHVTDEVFRKAVPGKSSLMVVTRRGWLRAEWVESYILLE